MRGAGLPEGHVCQSQETGAKVGGAVAESGGTLSGKTVNGVKPACRLKSFQCALVKLLINLATG